MACTFLWQVILLFTFCSQIDSIHWFLLSYRYFGTVNHTKGWCPGSKAATFSQNGSYATVPNINITTCDFTIALWVKYNGVDGPILALWSKDGKLFYVTVKNSRLILSIHNTFHLQINYWNHVAVTCQQHKIKVFVNGTEKACLLYTSPSPRD